MLVMVFRNEMKFISARKKYILSEKIIKILIKN